MADVIFFLVLLMVIISAVGNAVGRAKGKAESSRAEQRVRSTFDKHPPPLHRGPVKAPPYRAEASGRPVAPAGTEAQKNIRPMPKLQLRRESSAVHSSVERIFREEDRLVAAFIFHEILGPPRSLRRR